MRNKKRCSETSNIKIKEMEAGNRRNEVFLYIGAFFVTAASLSVAVLILLL